MKRTPLRSRTPLQRRSRLSQRTGLAREGRRARRMRSADRREERLSHNLPCVCGCGAGPGEVARAHMVGRSVESVRNEAPNNLPACAALSDWLDHTVGGVKAKKVLRTMAVEANRRLTVLDCEPVLRLNGYYEWRVRAGW